MVWWARDSDPAGTAREFGGHVLWTPEGAATVMVPLDPAAPGGAGDLERQAAAGAPEARPGPDRGCDSCRNPSSVLTVMLVDEAGRQTDVALCRGCLDRGLLIEGQAVLDQLARSAGDDEGVDDQAAGPKVGLHVHRAGTPCTCTEHRLAPDAESVDEPDTRARSIGYIDTREVWYSAAGVRYVGPPIDDVRPF